MVLSTGIIAQIDLTTHSDEFKLVPYERSVPNVVYYPTDAVPKIEKKTPVFLDQIIIGKENYLFSTVTDKHTMTHTLYAFRFKNGKLLEEAKQIDQHDIKDTWEWENYTKYNFIPSEDGKKMLIIQFEPYTVNKILFVVLDDKLNELWSQRFELKETSRYDEHYNYSNFILTNEGDLYFKGAIKKEKTEQVKGSPDYIIHIYHYEYSKRKLNELKIDLQDVFVRDYTLTLMPERLIFTGLYANKLYKPYKDFYIDGSFFVSLDRSCSKVNCTSIINLSAKYAKEHLKNLKLSTVYFPSDGGIELLNEQTWLRGGTTNKIGSPGETMGGPTTYYYFDNIFVLKMHEKQELNWAAKIAKYQLQLGGPEAGSFVSFFENDNTHLFYNKSKKQVESKDTSDLEPSGNVRNKMLKEPITWQVSINAKGEKTADHPFFKNMPAPFVFPDHSSYTDKKELIMSLELGETSRSYKLVKMK